MNQTASAGMQNLATVPVGSSTTMQKAEFLVSHAHAETGQSFGLAGGGIIATTEATGQDAFQLDQFTGATVTVDFRLTIQMFSQYSYSIYSVDFQSTYFGFSLMGDSNEAELVLRDGAGNVVSTDSNYLNTGPGAYGSASTHLVFTLPAVAQMSAIYESEMWTQFAGDGSEEAPSRGEEQFLNWGVSFLVNP